MPAVKAEVEAMPDIDRMLSATCGHVHLTLTKLPRARVLWVNTRACVQDPKFGELNGDLEAYGQHLLVHCAFALDMDPATTGSKVIATADRYGGVGIGCNGGSGRAAYVNGYYVKGIGVTPLVGLLADKVHSTGRCELEECIREAIVSECIDAEFPWGAIPVFAIIGTGLFKSKTAEVVPGLHSISMSIDSHGTTEQCLLIRPAFIRPAHFERADSFCP